MLSTHLLLLRRLLRYLQGKPARIVVTVSNVHFGDISHTGGAFPSTDWATPDALFRPGAYVSSPTVRAGRRAYATSKLGGIYLLHGWARRLYEGVDILADNPSPVIGTGLAHHAGVASDSLMKHVISALAHRRQPLRTPGHKLADAIL